jgi:hypothetical protein
MGLIHPEVSRTARSWELVCASASRDDCPTFAIFLVRYASFMVSYCTSVAAPCPLPAGVSWHLPIRASALEPRLRGRRMACKTCAAAGGLLFIACCIHWEGA